MFSSPDTQHAMIRLAPRHTRIWVGMILAALPVISGCLGVEGYHFVVEPSETGETTVKLGGQVTDQIIRILERNEFDVEETLQQLRKVTVAAPVLVVDNDTLQGTGWTGDEIWAAAIDKAAASSFSASLKRTYLNLSDISLGLVVTDRQPSDPSPQVNWVMCERDFIGTRVTHFNLNSSMVPVRIREDGRKFVFSDSGETFVPWGVQMYLRHKVDGQWQLLTREELVVDFKFLRTINVNCVRIHVEYHRVMKSPELADPAFLEYLEMVLDVAEQTGIYLDVTGLDCYLLETVPDWYHELDEEAHWEMQARYWSAVSRVCAGRPCVLFYNLINEPIVSGGDFNPDYPWIVDGAYAGEYFLQRLVVDINGRDPKVVAKAWIDKMVGTIRQHDPHTPTTIGAIGWSLLYENHQPLFYDAEVAENLDVVCVHHYPDQNADNEERASRIAKYEIGKPIIIEETYLLRCTLEVFSDFIDNTLSAGTDGWVTYFSGQTFTELRKEGSFQSALQIIVLEFLRDNAARIRNDAR